MTTRERKENRAARLREYADKRNNSAQLTLTAIHNNPVTHDWAFITQPGYIPERARINRAQDRAFESMSKASSMESRADGIEAQIDRAIYDDDSDVVERLQEKIARLEKELANENAGNKAWRKGKADGLRNSGIPENMIAGGLSTMRVCPYLKHPFFSTNTSATLRTTKQRLERVEREKVTGKPWKYYHASKYESVCCVCGETIARGEQILYRKNDDGTEVKHYHACSPAASLMSR